MGAVNAIEIRYFLEELDRKLMKKRKKNERYNFFHFFTFSALFEISDLF